MCDLSILFWLAFFHHKHRWPSSFSTVGFCVDTFCHPISRCWFSQHFLAHICLMSCIGDSTSCSEYVCGLQLCCLETFDSAKRRRVFMHHHHTFIGHPSLFNPQIIRPISCAVSYLYVQFVQPLAKHIDLWS